MIALYTINAIFYILSYFTTLHISDVVDAVVDVDVTVGEVLDVVDAVVDVDVNVGDVWDDVDTVVDVEV